MTRVALQPFLQYIESGTNYNTNCHIDHISFYGEIFKLFKKGNYRNDFEIRKVLMPLKLTKYDQQYDLLPIAVLCGIDRQDSFQNYLFQWHPQLF